MKINAIAEKPQFSIEAAVASLLLNVVRLAAAEQYGRQGYAT